MLGGHIDGDEVVVLELQHGDDLAGAVGVVIIPGGRELHGDLIAQEADFPAGQQLHMEVAGHRLGLLSLILQFHDLLPKSEVFRGQIGDGPDCNATDDHRYNDCDDNELGECGDSFFHGDQTPFCNRFLCEDGRVAGFLAFIIHDNWTKCQNGIFTAITIDRDYEVFCGLFCKERKVDD